jgi:predicted transcriptional regulator
MTVLKGQAELDSYKLTKKEIADYLGISTNAVRMSMRGSNYHNLEYRKSAKGFLLKCQRDLVITWGPTPH